MKSLKNRRKKTITFNIEVKRNASAKQPNDIDLHISLCYRRKVAMFTVIFVDFAVLLLLTVWVFLAFWLIKEHAKASRHWIYGVLVLPVGPQSLAALTGVVTRCFYSKLRGFSFSQSSFVSYLFEWRSVCEWVLMACRLFPFACCNKSSLLLRFIKTEELATFLVLFFQY